LVEGTLLASKTTRPRLSPFGWLYHMSSGRASNTQVFAGSWRYNRKRRNPTALRTACAISKSRWGSSP